MPSDPTINIKNQHLRDGADWEVGGKLNIDTAAGGTLQVDDHDVTSQLKGQPHSVTLTPAPGAGGSNICNVTIQVLDASGNAIPYPLILTWLLSDAASGAGLTATAPSTSAGAGAAGTDLAVLVSKEATIVQTNNAGEYILSIHDTAKTPYYVVANIPGQKPFVSAQLATASYG